MATLPNTKPDLLLLCAAKQAFKKTYNQPGYNGVQLLPPEASNSFRSLCRCFGVGSCNPTRNRKLAEQFPASGFTYSPAPKTNPPMHPPALRNVGAKGFQGFGCKLSKILARYALSLSMKSTLFPANCSRVVPSPSPHFLVTSCKGVTERMKAEIWI